MTSSVFAGGKPPRSMFVLVLAAPGVLLLTFLTVLAMGWSVRYVLEPEQLIIEAKLGPFDQGRVIPRSSIRVANTVTVQNASRTRGTAMPGYCNGQFEIDGRRAWLATSCSPALVLVVTESWLVGLSPQGPLEFIAALEQPGSSASFEVEPHDDASGFGFLLLAVIALPFGGLVLWMIRIARPLEYRVEGGRLYVPGNFGHVSVQLTGARVDRGDPGRLWRLWGTGFPGFHLGRYRAFGATVHMAATRSKDLVFVDGDRKVVVSPLDASAFLAALEANGARRV